MIRGQNLPAITQIADSDVLIVDSTGGGTRKITYAQLCQAVKQTLGIREVIDSVNITEDGYLMGGKVIADEFAKLNNEFVYSTNNLNESINIPKDGCYLVMVRGLSENGSAYLGILRNGGYIANSHKAVTEAMTLFTFYIGRLSADDVLTIFRENIQDAQNVHFCFAVMWLRD